ncbi:hypothetical protein [Embleya sp. NPDC005575]|uniref:hypothetical protein n=1 Tax=Embleya sp. NPDC005575 TaxID=3156892 RepID=UPI0033A837E0
MSAAQVGGVVEDLFPGGAGVFEVAEVEAGLGEDAGGDRAVAAFVAGAQAHAAGHGRFGVAGVAEGPVGEGRGVFRGCPVEAAERHWI